MHDVIIFVEINISVCFYSVSSLKLRNFQGVTMRIRWQMPAFIARVHLIFCNIGYPKTSTTEDIKVHLRFFVLGLRILLVRLFAEN